MNFLDAPQLAVIGSFTFPAFAELRTDNYLDLIMILRKDVAG